MMRRFLATLTGLALLAGAAAYAAPLTADEAFGASPPWGAQPSRITWSPDGSSFLYVLPTQNAQQPLPLRQYDVRTAQSRVVVDPAAYGGKPKTPSDVTWAPDGRSFAFTLSGTLYVRDLSTGLDRTVATGVEDALWSPRGGAIAYTHQADLYLAVLSPELRVTRLTKGGIPDTILNGDLDWVYPEELGIVHGFAWSPDGRRIAYMTMDERRVTNFPIVDFLPHDNKLIVQRYPLAGEQNPRVSLKILDLQTRSSKTLYDAGPRDEYLAAFGWKPGSQTLVAELLDRAQQHLRVLAWDRTDSAPATLYAQSDPDWVDAIALPMWLHDGSSLWVLARDNVWGLYVRNRAGELRRINAGYRIFDLLGLDEKRGVAYVTAAFPTRRDRSLLAIPFSGEPAQDLTPSAGVHAVWLSPALNLFVETRSTLNDPPQTDLVSTSGSVRATLAPEDRTLRAQMLPAQMLSVDSQYGKLDAYMIRPPDFDPHRRYPVVIYVYGGPATPTTANGFGYMRGMYHQLLAQHGFIVFSIDGPASQIDNEAHVRLLYHNFGPASLAGQEIGVQYLRSLPYVDASRIGIWGWSFGGFETAYALTHTTLFKAGAAGAPVTDWHLYDTIYTERYMGTPQSDAKAYDMSSVLTAASALHGDLLISHGTSDDNVHMANSISLLQELVQSDERNVDFMAYPRQHHGFSALADSRQLYEHMLEWWTQHL
jgi:dipeptidyl-peptidase-4